MPRLPHAIIDPVVAPFNKIFSDEMKISFPHIQSLVESYRERQRTGIIRLAYSDERQLYLFLKRGKPLNTYIVSHSTFESIDSERWTDSAQAEGDAYTRLIPLSPFGLLICKILIQTPPESVTTEHLSSSQLSKYLDSAKTKKEISLANIEWPEACGAVFFPGDAENIHSLYLSAEELQDELGILAIFKKWDGIQSAVTKLNFDLSLDVWQEYSLRRSFSDICERTLARFEAMAGRALVDSLIRLVVVYASRQDLDINISSRRLVDREIFSSPKQAAEAYHKLLKEMFTHFSVVIGPRLLSSTLREIVNGLPQQERDDIQKFSLLSQGYYYE